MNINQGQENYGWNTTSPCECHSYVIPKIYEFIPSGKLKILDAGCGNGYLASSLASSGHNVVAIDISEDGILLAQKKYPNILFKVRSVYDNLSDLGIDFNLVISSEVIEHLYFPQKFLNNLWSILQPGGYLILSTPYHGWLKNLLISLFGLWDKHHTVDWEGGHIKFFSQNSLSKMLLDAGFSNIEFINAGRIKWLWKSMIVRAQKK